MRDTTFFYFSKLFFIQNYRFLYDGDQKISWWTSCRWRAVNFEIHLWSSGMNADCIWRSISIQFERAGGVPRQQALQKRRRVTNDRVPLLCSWNERLPDLRRLLRQYFPVLQSEASLEQCFTAPPLLSFWRTRNLRDILVYGTQKNTSAQDPPIGTHKCLHSRCLTCPIVHNITQIQTNSGLKHIRDSFTYDTSSLVYVITCSKCNSVYVGETGQKLRERTNGHRADIKGELNPEMKLSQSIELFVTKRLPPIRSLSDVWFSSCASWKSAATPPEFGRDTPFWRHWHSDWSGGDREKVVFQTFRKISAFSSRVVPTGFCRTLLRV